MQRKKALVAGLCAVAMLLAASFLTSGTVQAEALIVDRGEATAVIVIPEQPPSSVRMAASELQEYILKMSGATLPILSEADEGQDDAAQTRIYLGNSRHTERLGVSGQGLQWGAYRMKSGDGWLALVGNDTVFTPQGVYGMTRNEWNNQKRQEWDEATGAYWNNPIGGRMFTEYDRDLDLWSYDEKGTLNAVYGFLRSLGVRWYMPGELGEVVPARDTIALPGIDETVTPDFDVRLISLARYHLPHAREALVWTLRLGFNNPYGFNTHHGIANVTRRQEIREAHPEYFALINNVRQVRDRTANACLSSEGLFQENLRFVRFMLDMYDVPVVDVMPDDGFSSICQCEKCEGKDTPERGRQGIMSDYVWDYVNRLAIEVAKTHPGKYISCGAYSTYWLPPANIETLNDNVLVYVVNGRRRYNIGEEELALRRQVLREWKEKTGNDIIVFMNHGGAANTPRIFAEDIRDAKAVAMGEDLWVPTSGGGLANPGFNHLNIYISSRFEWDAEQDIDDLLSEYYGLFYGPAAEEMAAFVDFYEMRQRDMRAIDSAPVIKEALDLYEAAKEKVDPETVYGQRVALFGEGLASLRNRYEQVKAGRVGVPTYTVSREAEDMSGIVIDGKLDEAFWSDLPGVLKELHTGEDVVYPTTFKIGVHDHNLYVGILCKDNPGEPLSIGGRARNDFAIWQGDVIEILLETPEHSYYQIAVNPAGAVADLDRSAGLAHGVNWDAQAEVAVHVDEEAGYWSVEARIPFTPSSQDPLHQVVGPTPSAEQPWHFNICRQRTRDQGANMEMSAFSPTGERGFHHILKFGKLE